MPTQPRFLFRGSAWLGAGCVAGLTVVFAGIGGDSPAVAGDGPDVTVFSFTDIRGYGVTDGFAAYSIGTHACNRGDTPVNWCSSTGCVPGAGPTDHPVIAQNLYRLKNGRFEQIGMSWLKHGFASANFTTAGCSGAAGESCQTPPGGQTQLGVGCTDPYNAITNGRQPLGPRSQVNATTGVFPPPTSPPGPYLSYDERIKVALADIDPALNAGTTYWAEGHYVAKDDAGAGNAFNNASYRQVTVGGAPIYPLTMVGDFHELQPAIFAWRTQEPGVDVASVDVPGAALERFHVARRVTDLGAGLWHYEYAVHNLNSDRSARTFAVRFPGSTAFANVGSKVIPHHSGEPYSVAPWTSSALVDTLTWSTDAYATDPNANALRWATMFNFWFDADRPPTDTVHRLDLFKPGTPDFVEFTLGNGIFQDGLESGDASAWGWVQQ